MDLNLLTHNLLAPAFLAFLCGVIARFCRSDLSFPEQLTTSLSIYLLFAIGLKGGAALSSVDPSTVIAPAIATLLLGSLIPVLAYPLARRLLKLDRTNAAAMTAHYASTSAVTFLAASAYLTHRGEQVEGFMPGLLALMEVPGIAVALWLGRRGEAAGGPLLPVIGKVLSGKSIVLLLAGMMVGMAADPAGLEKINAFFVAPFVGILCLFLLDLGTIAAERLQGLDRRAWRMLVFALVMPLIGGTLGVFVGSLSGLSCGGSTLMGVLCASASYIAAPAAVRMALPEADLGACLASSLGITFPFNLALGIPLCHSLAQKLTS
jgi:uncharacterized protein